MENLERGPPLAHAPICTVYSTTELDMEDGLNLKGPQFEDNLKGGLNEENMLLGGTGAGTQSDLSHWF